MASLCLLSVLLLGLQCACAKRVYIDMTYKLTNTTVRIPGSKAFTLKETWKGPWRHVEWLAINNIETPEHIGTHVDSPYHSAKYGWKLDEVPFERLHGPAVVINIEKRAEKDRDAMVYSSDLKAWEERNGRIPDGAYVLMNSGWGQYWDDQVKFVGSKDNITNLHHPGFSEDAAQWLAENRPKISAVGSDTVSCDKGATVDYPTHVILQRINVLCVENVANMDKLPEVGAEVFAMPWKFHGTGSPIRMYAVLDDHDDCAAWTSGQARVITMMWYCHALLFFLCFVAVQ